MKEIFVENVPSYHLTEHKHKTKFEHSHLIVKQLVFSRSFEDHEIYYHLLLN